MQFTRLDHAAADSDDRT